MLIARPADVVERIGVMVDAGVDVIVNLPLVASDHEPLHRRETEVMPPFTKSLPQWAPTRSCPSSECDDGAARSRHHNRRIVVR